MIFDEARIFVKGGAGGNGAMAFRREKFVPRGGPSGGNGGNGGGVYLQVDLNQNTLINFTHQAHFSAERGGHGKGKDQYGAVGEDLIIPVPAGTMVREAETGKVLGDLIEPGQRLLVAKGGRGGRGNAAFKTSIRTAPRLAEKGLPGDERWLLLELKLIADVGLVGFPNAGKSTLLSAVSAAHPKIADYPFTTLEPMLGVVEIDDKSFVMADIPGLIEGAHQGVGLGHEFLRHIERTRLLLYLLNGANAEPFKEFEDLRRELRLHDPRLAERPGVIVLNKIDLPEAKNIWKAVSAGAQREGMSAFAVSAVTGEGLPKLLRWLAEEISHLPLPLLEPEEAEVPVYRLEDDDKYFEISPESKGWRIKGKRVQELAMQTRFELPDSAARFQRALRALGVLDALNEKGVKEGDMVYIGPVELEWLW